MCFTTQALVLHKKAKHDGGQCPYCLQKFSVLRIMRDHVKYCVQAQLHCVGKTNVDLIRGEL